MTWGALDIWWTSSVTRKTLFLLFLAQVDSFILALVSFSSSLVADLGVNAPITETSFTYFTWALVYGSILLDRRQKPRVAWYWSFWVLLMFKGIILLSGATMFNLSMLTSDMWVVVIRIFFYQQQVDWLYYLTFMLAVIGLFILFQY